MNDDEVRRTLLLEAHRCVDSAADAAVAKIGLRRSRPAPKDGEIDTEALLIYPPNNSLSLEEEQAIRSMKLSPVERSALKKVIADGCATAFFDFFTLIDGAADPELELQSQTWLGASLIARRGNVDQDVLHDAFYDSYEEYAHQRHR